ncbi:MAG: hypothetical protein LV481_17310 [Methylacidiphilales bacterium]|nr:hypothetical protein [Candidatus Methylacidiphilales bacterium]
MDPDAFTDLALRVIAREATDEDRRALDAELAARPERRGEFAELQSTHDILRTTAPLTEAARARGPELPAYRLNELRTAVRQHFGPAVNRERKPSPIFAGLRWIFTGTAVAVLGVAVVLICFSNSTIEIGLYRTDLVRGDNAGLTPESVPTARIVTFDADAAFDQWQSRPLVWYQHAKIWVDNEHDLVHVIRREQNGRIDMLTLPLAATDEAQREQIRQIVQDSRK